MSSRANIGVVLGSCPLKCSQTTNFVCLCSAWCRQMLNRFSTESFVFLPATVVLSSLKRLPGIMQLDSTRRRGKSQSWVGLFPNELPKIPSTLNMKIRRWNKRRRKEKRLLRGKKRRRRRVRVKWKVIEDGRASRWPNVEGCLAYRRKKQRKHDGAPMRNSLLRVLSRVSLSVFHARPSNDVISR